MRADAGDPEAYFASHGFLRAWYQLAVMSGCLYRALHQGTWCFQLANIFQSSPSTHTVARHAHLDHWQIITET
ncbi:Alpha-mannosidase [Clarias magur]|uniref:Alpha-mannosidase n=1 Tax=Clarias magur TaxID=1594786 RepID=A0A8J4UNJ0_CLAMG|nr:Alpha-mannosidase [Clarias magur]